MSESVTAEIIPFPSRAVASPEALAPGVATPAARSAWNPPLVANPLANLPATRRTDFPGAALPRSEPTPAEARLTRALAGLNNAVTAQRAAMTAWKAALGDLKTVTGRLGASLRSYNDSLGHLDARVNTLRTEAVKLEAWADDVIAKKL